MRAATIQFGSLLKFETLLGGRLRNASSHGYGKLVLHPTLTLGLCCMTDHSVRLGTKEGEDLLILRLDGDAFV